MEQAANVLVLLVGIYVAIGVVFSLAFVIFGVGRIDPAAKEGTVGFRILVFPGSVALWPLLVRRWLKRQAPPEERSPHRDRVRREGGG